MSAPAIRVAGLSKRFRIGERVRYKSLRESIQNAVAAPFRRGRRAEETIWALRDVSFEVAPGEVVGVIGRNGAGKSTLLKVLSRITEPTEGRVELRGRVGSLLEVGTGFHLELTGRENIYLNGAILGMKRAEIERRFDEIVAFAEVERFLDTPVKHYSTGMYLRLAFAVAAHLEPEILLVDEVLAVGDAAFQKKCLGKMGDVARGGRTVLFVSHNMPAVLNLCSRVVLLKGGRFAFSGDPEKAVLSYQSLFQTLATPSIADRRDRLGVGSARIVDLKLVNASNPTLHTLRSSDRLRVEMAWESSGELVGAALVVGIYTGLGQSLYRLDSEGAGGLSGPLPKSGRLACETGAIALTPGRYSVNVAIVRRSVLIDHVEQAAWFDVEASDFYGTGLLPPHHEVPCLLSQEWELVEQ